MGKARVTTEHGSVDAEMTLDAPRLGKEELAAGEGRYATEIKAISHDDIRTLAEFLTTRYREGRLAMALEDKPDYWGGKCLENMAEDLGHSVETARCCLRVAKALAKEPKKLETRYIAKGFSWSTLVRTITIDDTADREKLEDRALKEHWPSRRVEQEVKTYHAKARALAKKDKTKPKPENRGGVKGAQSFKMAADRCVAVIRALDDALPFLREHKKKTGDDKRREELPLSILREKMSAVMHKISDFMMEK